MDIGAEIERRVANLTNLAREQGHGDQARVTVYYGASGLASPWHASLYGGKYGYDNVCATKGATLEDALDAMSKEIVAQKPMTLELLAQTLGIEP